MKKIDSRAPQNRTLICSKNDMDALSKKLVCVNEKVNPDDIKDRVINGNIFEVSANLPKKFVDLLILDPPYNLSKEYNGNSFKEKSEKDYKKWFEQIITALRPTLKPNATIYVCSDWKTSTIIAPILKEFFHLRNRITWERDKGRGAKANWKNNTEDIWFCTLSDDFYFNIDAVKVKRKVIAPYRIDGQPKDWQQSDTGNFRLTHPSNIWTDLTVPFWSMPENTDHPTQKPEKLIAKLILASCPEGGFILDPFVGSGTTSVVAEKLGRHHCGVEIDETYCYWALKRLELAKAEKNIQGYTDGVFWERNSLGDQKIKNKSKEKEQGSLFK